MKFLGTISGTYLPIEIIRCKCVRDKEESKTFYKYSCKRCGIEWIINKDNEGDN